MSSPATVPLTYNGYLSAIAALAVVQTTTVGGVVQGQDARFNAFVPSMLNYAELRIQRDLDLWPALSANTNYSLTIGSNVLSISVDDYVSVQTIGVTVNGTPVPLLPVSKEFLQNIYGSPTFVGPPQYFAPYGGDQATGGNTSNNFLVGPYPDLAYPVTLTGMIRLPSLYLNATTPLAGTATTFISSFLPDLLIQASMVMVAQYQRNFGPTSNDPDMGNSYEAQYQTLLKGALTEEARKRFAAQGWAPMGLTTLATPTR